MNDAAVCAVSLSRNFSSASGEPVCALRSISFSLPQRSFTLLRGPSGCGKTTLLNLLGALDRPDAGSLFVFGSEISGLSDDERALFRRSSVGYLFQDGGLIERMSVSENIGLSLVYRHVDPIERSKRVRICLDQVGLTGRMAAQVDELSGGERIRVALARALVSEPKILLGDEPTAALDEDNSRRIGGLLRLQARAGVTVVCSSHDPILVEYADQVIDLVRGTIASETSC